MKLEYKKNTNNSMYFLSLDGMMIPQKICDYIGITFEEYIENIKLCNGKYSSKYGWFLPNEEKALECITLLTLSKK